MTSMKRRNDNAQQKKEEVESLNEDDEEEPTNVREMPKANEWDLSQRRILKAKRPSDKPSATSENSKNPFLGLDSNKSVGNPFNALNAPNPFANFKGLSNDSGKEMSQNLNPSANFKGLSNDSQKVAIQNSNSNTFEKIAPKQISLESEYNKKIKKLNNSFVGWIEKQIQEHPFSSWKDGVKDFIKYNDEVTEKFGGSNDKNDPVPLIESTPAVTTHTFPVVPTTKFEFPNLNPTMQPPLSNPFSKSLPALDIPNSAFSTTPKPSTTTVDFMSKSSLNQPFSFSTAFPNFFNSNPMINKPTSTVDETANDEEDDENEPKLEPEKVLKNAQDSEEIFVEVPCKLYRYEADTKEWRDLGKGNFIVSKSLKVSNSKMKMMVRNPVGNIIFNASFYPSMKIQTTKKGFQFMAFVVGLLKKVDNKSVISTQPEMCNFILKVKPSDETVVMKVMEDGITKSAAS